MCLSLVVVDDLDAHHVTGGIVPSRGNGQLVEELVRELEGKGGKGRRS